MSSEIDAGIAAAIHPSMSYSRGGGGSHWTDCHEDSHWDCRIAWLEEQKRDLLATLERMVGLCEHFYNSFGDFMEEFEGVVCKARGGAPNE